MFDSVLHRILEHWKKNIRQSKMIQGKKRGADAAGDNQAKMPKFDKKAPPKGKFDSQNAEKKPFKKSGEPFNIHTPIVCYHGAIHLIQPISRWFFFR